MQYNSQNLRSQILFCLSALTFSTLTLPNQKSNIAIAQLISSSEHRVNQLRNQPQDRQLLQQQEQLLEQRQQQLRENYRQRWNQRRQKWNNEHRSQQLENRHRRQQNQDAVYQRNEIRREQRNRQRQIIVPPRPLR